MSLAISVLEEKISSGIKSIEEELGVAGIIAIAEGSPSCPHCLRIEVNDVDSFLKILEVLAKQGIATGTLPIIVLKKKTTNRIAYYIVNPADQLIVALEHEIKY